MDMRSAHHGTAWPIKQAKKSNKPCLLHHLSISSISIICIVVILTDNDNEDDVNAETRGNDAQIEEDAGSAGSCHSPFDVDKFYHNQGMSVHNIFSDWPGKLRVN